ncbi:MAG: PEP-CTERM sorting domain-containing protein [Acidobacteria bacterium]|nr:PEP-CTERM sorting domain-containing protein [Acidobacteriota bacterium]
MVGFNTWYQFGIDSTGGSARGCVNTAQRCLDVPNTTPVAAPTWDLPVAFDFAVTLTVTDAFEVIDLFEILNNGQPVPASSLPVAASSLAPAAVCNPLDLMSCVNDPAYASLTTTFAPGTPISLNFLITQRGAPIDGSAFFILTGVPDTQLVPEPSTWLLLAGGLVAAGALRRRSR